MSAGSTESPDGRLPADDSPASWALPRGVVVLLGTAAAVLTAAGLRGFSEIVGPIFLALVLTIAVSPLRRLLIRRGAPRWLAGLIALVVVISLLLGLAAALALAVAQLAHLLPEYQDKVTALLDDARGWLAERGIGEEQIQAAIQAFDLGKLLDLLQSWLSGLLGIFSDLAFIVVLLFFMGIDATRFTERLIEAARMRPGVAGALTDFARGTTRYLIVSTVFGLIVAIVDVGVLYLLDIPLPWLWGLLAFITNYIPNVGFVIGVIPPALLGLLDSGWTTLLWVVIAYSIINFIIQSIIQPKVVGDAVGLTPSLTFISLVFWAWILGPLGAVLAIPLSLLAKSLLLDADPSTRWMGGLISGTPVLDKAADPAPEGVPPAEVPAEQVG
ncbi:putative PurR-regulated permease PerM [Kribbella steppae]|uniref:Putative PurR-regulated permease PerM n=1 Tax=Kribbella steppae TaxID=2512223 RepID=A0A4R2H4A5_9ACTN|nr:AI-2E family transporter [Kribbella steppae]TCO20424.1 putative PurR-regulated permease PerM [Kribbella steppae]